VLSTVSLVARVRVSDLRTVSTATSLAEAGFRKMKHPCCREAAPKRDRQVFDPEDARSNPHKDIDGA
jgi:hypothetical protein